jgi:hypothetical protein
MISDNEIEQIRIRLLNAIKGPWKAFVEGRNHECCSDFIQT